MKPSKIFLVRHGQSIGNARKEEHAVTPDYALWLTDLGKSQAKEAGEKLRTAIGDGKTMFYVSSYRRTRETFREITRSFDAGQFDYRDDPRLREQEWNRQFDSDAYRDESKARDAYGHFYYRFMGGRITLTFTTVYRGFLIRYTETSESPIFPIMSSL